MLYDLQKLVLVHYMSIHAPRFGRILNVKVSGCRDILVTRAKERAEGQHAGLPD